MLDLCCVKWLRSVWKSRLDRLSSSLSVFCVPLSMAPLSPNSISRLNWKTYPHSLLIHCHCVRVQWEKEREGEMGRSGMRQVHWDAVFFNQPQSFIKDTHTHTAGAKNILPLGGKPYWQWTCGEREERLRGSAVLRSWTVRLKVMLFQTALVLPLPCLKNQQQLFFF